MSTQSPSSLVQVSHEQLGSATTSFGQDHLVYTPVSRTGKYLFLLVPGGWTSACSPRSIHIDPIFEFVWIRRIGQIIFQAPRENFPKMTLSPEIR